MQDLTELEEHYRAAIKGDYGRQLAMGAAPPGWPRRRARRRSTARTRTPRSHGETFLNLLEQRLVVEGALLPRRARRLPAFPTLRQLSLISLLKQVVADVRQPAGDLHPTRQS